MGGRRTIRQKLLLAALLLVLIGWPIRGIVGYLGQGAGGHDAPMLLYQVALFQMELLGSAAAEAAQADSTRQLDALRLSAYSANFTHERLVLAVNDKAFVKLASVGELVQVALRLQIAGDRPLKSEEKAVLSKAAPSVQAIVEGYSKLLRASGKPVPSQNERLAKLDQELTELLHKGLLR